MPRTRFSPSTVIALLALVVALGGTSYAAAKITGKQVRNSSLTGADVKNRSLTGADVRDGSLVAADFGPGQLPRAAGGADGPPGPAGPAGPAGPQGPKGDTGPAGRAAPTPSATATAGDELRLGQQPVTVVALRLSAPGPARIQTWASAELSGTAESIADRVACQLRVGDAAASIELATSITPETGGGHAAVSPVGTRDVEAGEHVVRLQCREFQGDVAFEDGTLTAIAVPR